MKRFFIPFLLLYIAGSINGVLAQSQIITEVKEDTSTVITFLESTNEHNTLLKALHLSGLKERLLDSESFTILAPNDDAFKKLKNGTLETLLLEENKDKLKAILAYHVISGSVNTASMSKVISNNHGEANFKTLNGSEITAFIKEGLLVFEDEKGNEAFIETPDKQQSNGYVHIVDTVLLPN